MTTSTWNCQSGSALPRHRQAPFGLGLESTEPISAELLLEHWTIRAMGYPPGAVAFAAVSTPDCPAAALGPGSGLFEIRLCWFEDFRDSWVEDFL